MGSCVVYVVVESGRYEQWIGEGTDTFSVAVPSDAPFQLLACEFEFHALPSGQGFDQPIHQVMQQSFAAVTEDVTGVELNFPANALPTHTADVTIATPTRADSPVRTASGMFLVCPLSPAACAGWTTHVDISADGNQFEASLLWAEPYWADPPLTCAYASDDRGVLSNRWVSDWPTGGSMGSLPDTLAWVTPAERRTRFRPSLG